MLTLYYAVNTCSLATHIALEDARARISFTLLILPKRNSNHRTT
jgi:hypothetical protein